MPSTKEERSKRFSQPPGMRPNAIVMSDMAEDPSLDRISTKKPSRRTTKTGYQEDVEDDGFLVLDTPDKMSVVDVFLGDDKKLVQLPVRLALGLASLLLHAPERRTTYTPAGDAAWQSLDLDGWWKELIRTGNVSGGPNQTYHMTETLSLPQIGLDRFMAVKEWATRKGTENPNRADSHFVTEEQARASRKRLHLDLWTMLDEFSYEKNVRARSDGVETEIDPDDDIGEAHGGGDL